MPEQKANWRTTLRSQCISGRVRGDILCQSFLINSSIYAEMFTITEQIQLMCSDPRFTSFKAWLLGKPHSHSLTAVSLNKLEQPALKLQILNLAHLHLSAICCSYSRHHECTFSSTAFVDTVAYLGTACIIRARDSPLSLRER